MQHDERDAVTRPDQAPERRQPDVPDRRAAPRGGRRASDALIRIADFVFKLMTEPPR